MQGHLDSFKEFITLNLRLKLPKVTLPPSPPPPPQKKGAPHNKVESSHTPVLANYSLYDMTNQYLASF